MKYKLKENSGTYMYKKTIILKATDILAVQMLKFIGEKYHLIGHILEQIDVNPYLGLQIYEPKSTTFFV
jgi:hypothetical protein